MSLTMFSNDSEKKREKKRRALSSTSVFRNKIFTTLGLVAVLLVILFITITLLSIARLQMENSVERALNNVVLAIEDSTIPISVVMAESGVRGFGIYSSYGNLLYSEGDVYTRLPVVNFEWGERNTLTNSISNYDSYTNTVEYVRFSRKAIIPTSQSLLVAPELGLMDFPNIIYMSYDASEYGRTVLLVEVSMALLSLVLVAVYFIILHTLSENKRYRELFAKQERLVSLGQAARTLTHEIKNPLSAIMLQLAILKKTSDGKNEEDFQVIENETRRLIALADKVSEFLHNPIGNPEEMELKTELSSLFSLFRGKGDIEFSFTVEGKAFVMFDKDRFRSVFENLIKNAFESMEDMEKKPVEIFLEKNRKGFYVIHVMDRGCGIKGEDRNKIFDPFYTTKIHGSGIGLSISRQFVEAAGGSIDILDRYGGGTDVSVSLKAKLS